jgi:hypothetical protein
MKLPLSSFISKKQRKTYESNYKSSLSTGLKALKIIKLKREELGNDPSDNILNFIQYLILTHLDLVCTLRQFMTGETMWELGLTSRTCSLTITRVFLY